MTFHRIAVITALLATAGLSPASAEAQWGPWGPMYPWYPNAYGRFAGPESDLKFDVLPKEAAVYVDGYFAGQVDDYDGAFQRLHISPGEHEIVVYLDGYRSLRQRLYLAPNRTRRIEGELEKLAAGAPPEPVPVPAEPPANAGRPFDDEDEMPAPGPMPRQRVLQPRRPPQPRTPPVPAVPSVPDGSSSSTTSPTLSIRVQPGGATVLIDGESWDGPSNNNERLIVQVAEGRHTLEVRRDGYEPFITEIDVRRGQTEPINISLLRRR